MMTLSKDSERSDKQDFDVAFENFSFIRIYEMKHPKLCIYTRTRAHIHKMHTRVHSFISKWSVREIQARRYYTYSLSHAGDEVCRRFPTGLLPAVAFHARVNIRLVIERAKRIWESLVDSNTRLERHLTTTRTRPTPRLPLFRKHLTILLEYMLIIVLFKIFSLRNLCRNKSKILLFPSFSLN